MKKTAKLPGFITLVAIIVLGLACKGATDDGNPPAKEEILPVLTGTVSISGTAEVGQTLTANIDDLGGSGAITYRWRRDGTTNIGAGMTYVVKAADVGSTITVTVTRSGNSGSVSSGATATVTHSGLPTLTGTVSITGTAQVGQTLTANTYYLGGSGDFSFQWMRNGTNIGYNSSTYTVQAVDVGSTITVTVTRSGNSGSVGSLPTAAVTHSGLPALTGTVSITGTAEVGQTLAANTYYLGGSGDFSFQWMRNGTNIGYNSGTYTVQTTDVGYTITVTVTRSGNSGSVSSLPTAPVTHSGLPALTGTVSITGTAEVGQTLTADTDGLGGSGTISYQWTRNGTAISNANSGTYIVQAADVGYTISVIVTRDGYSSSVESSATAAVIPRDGITEIAIDVSDSNEWELMEQTAQATANTNKTFTVSGTYRTYRWYLDGVQVGTSASYTLNKPAEVYQLTVVVTDNGGVSRSGHCWVTVTAN